MQEDNKQQEEQLDQVPLGSVDPEIEKLQASLAQAQDGWKRAMADFENYKRRKENENKELIEFAREVAVVKLLPTLDALGQALKHVPEYNQSVDSNQQTDFAKAYKNWQSGVGGIVVQLDKTLAELGVKKIEAVGKKFDPNFHEALREVETEGESGMVVEELQTGFELNGKVVRPSQVVISKKTA